MSSYSDDDSLAIELFIPSLGARDHSSECKSVCLLVWLTLFWLANFKDFLLWLYRNWPVRVCETTFREIACFQKAHSGVSPLSLLALRAAVVHFRWTPCFYCRTYICTASSVTVWADWQKASSPFSLWSRCKKGTTNSEKDLFATVSVTSAFIRSLNVPSCSTFPSR